MPLISTFTKSMVCRKRLSLGQVLGVTILKLVVKGGGSNNAKVIFEAYKHRDYAINRYWFN
jgi:hypothetical protein